MEQSKINLKEDNLCFQRFFPEGNYQSLIDCNKISKNEYEHIVITKLVKLPWTWKCVSEIEFKIPKLKKCDENEYSWPYNCCPENEYDVYILQKYFDFKWIKNNLFLSKVLDTDKNFRQKIFSKIKEYETKIQEKKLKTETKQVIIPIDKPLSIEQTWLLENAIFSVFTIVKFFMR